MGNVLCCVDDYTGDPKRSAILPSSAVLPHPVSLQSRRHALESGQRTRSSFGLAAEPSTAAARDVARLTADPALSPDDYRRIAESHRKRAQFHIQRRNDFSRRSQAAYAANNRTLAKQLSEDRKTEHRLFQQEHTLATRASFLANNAQTNLNDLHDLGGRDTPLSPDDRSAQLSSSALLPHPAGLQSRPHALEPGQSQAAPPSTAAGRHGAHLTYDPARLPDDYKRIAESHRERAQFHSQRKGDFSKRSKAAYEANDRSLAKLLSEHRKNEHRLYEQECALAASASFNANNVQRKVNEIDLHDLSVPDALEYLTERIDTCKAAGRKRLKVIVGRGNHSRGRVPVLGNTIRHNLRENGFVFTNHNTNAGVIIVQLRDVNPGRSASPVSTVEPARQTPTAAVPAESQSPPSLTATTQPGFVDPAPHTACTTTADKDRRVADHHRQLARENAEGQWMQDALAADAYFKANNAHRNVSEVDLHDLTVEEAKKFAMRRIEECKEAGVGHLTIITGSDKRSEGGVSFEVANALLKMGYSLIASTDWDPHLIVVRVNSVATNSPVNGSESGTQTLQQL